MKKKSLLILLGCSLLLGIYSFHTPEPSNTEELSSSNQLVLDKDETYKVIKVNGQIVMRKSGKALLQGDEFLATTLLDFKTQDSRAAVISPTKGRFVLTADNSTGKTNLVPGMSNISSRAGALINQIDLENHFKGNYVILESQKLKISKEAYPMNEKNFFFLQYEYEGEVINKKLAFQGDTLILDRSTIFTIDGKQVSMKNDLKCALKYRKSEQNENFLVSEFNLVTPSLNDLKSELEILLSNSPAKKTSDKVDEVGGYLLEFYGQADRDNLIEWMKSAKLL